MVIAMGWGEQNTKFLVACHSITLYTEFHTLCTKIVSYTKAFNKHNTDNNFKGEKISTYTCKAATHCFEVQGSVLHHQTVAVAFAPGQRERQLAPGEGWTHTSPTVEEMERSRSLLLGSRHPFTDSGL